MEHHLRTFLQRARWSRSETLFWVAVLGAGLLLPLWRVLGAQILVLGLFALSLDLAVGFAGVVTLGHAAFFGTGAFAAGWLAQAGWGEPVSAAILAGLAAAILGALCAPMVVRGHDLSRLMLTLGLNFLLFEAANRATSYTGGIDGLPGVEIDPVLGLFRLGLDGTVAFWYSACVAFALFLAARRLVNSPFGLALDAARLKPARAGAIGIAAPRVLAITYVVSAAIAGVAGAVLTQVTQYVSIDAFAFNRSADVLIILVLGGAGYLYGAFAGAALFVVLRELLSNLSPVFWQFWLGLALVLTVSVLRGGLGRFLRPLLGR